MVFPYPRGLLLGLLLRVPRSLSVAAMPGPVLASPGSRARPVGGVLGSVGIVTPRHYSSLQLHHVTPCYTYEFEMASDASNASDAVHAFAVMQMAGRTWIQRNESPPLKSQTCQCDISSQPHPSDSTYLKMIAN